MIKDHMLRFRLSDDLYKRFKHICIHFNLSNAKQMEAIIKSFVEIQEENIRKLDEAKKRK